MGYECENNEQTDDVQTIHTALKLIYVHFVRIDKLQG